MPKPRHNKPPLEPFMIKAARSVLGWTQADLAACMGRETSLVTFHETKAAKPNLHTYWKMRGAFENNGVEFIIENNRIVGVRWEPKP
jgi:ribosome-binding protein aMBF1 (putative translation factor)